MKFPLFAVTNNISLVSRLRVVAPLAILVGGVAAVLFTWQTSQRQVQEKRQAAFENEVAAVARQIETRFASTSQILRGLAGLFAASDEVSRQEFHRYVSVLHLDGHLQGIQGLGFAQQVLPPALAAHQKEIRATGFPEYVVWPQGERGLYTSIIYLEPFDWRNQRAFGYDMYSDSLRRRAMERARDTGAAALSEKVRLVQETEQDSQAGVLLYVPVYRGGDGGDSVAERRASLLGWVYAPLRMNDLVNSVMDSKVQDLAQRMEMSLYEGDKVAVDRLLYRLGGQGRGGGSFSVSEPLHIAGQTLLLRAYSTPAFAAAHSGGYSWQFVLVGCLVSMLLAAAAWELLGSYATISGALAESAQAQRLLSESQNELRAIFDTVGVGILLIDMEGRVVRSNQSMAEMFGGTQEALNSRALAELVPEDLHASVQANLQTLLHGNQQVISLERRYRRFDGGEFWGLLSARRLSDHAGEACGFVGVIVDLTERRDAEQRLQRSERRYRMLTETMQDVVWTLDAARLRFAYCSPSVERLCGYRADQVVGLGLAQAFGEQAEPLEALIRQRAEAFRKGTAGADYYTDEIRQSCKDGTVICTEVISSFFIDEDSERVFLRGVSRNISERKKNEELLRIAAVAFESREGMVVTDADGIVICTNRAFSGLTGYSAEEMLGKNMNIQQSGRHNREFYEAMWESILREGYWQGQIWNRRKDGQIYPAWLSISAVKNVAGQTTHYVGTSFDVSLQVQHESEIARLAFYDPLTGLPNRRLFFDRLGHAFAKSARNQSYGAVLYIDLDNFKMANDTLGHAAGDRLLEIVADRISSSIREGDSAARLGGDEFVVLLEDVATEQGAAQLAAQAVAEKLRQVLALPYHLSGAKAADWQSTSSLGIAIFVGQHESMESVLARADRAMYVAKQGGRNAVSLAGELQSIDADGS